MLRHSVEQLDSNGHYAIVHNELEDKPHHWLRHLFLALVTVMVFLYLAVALGAAGIKRSFGNALLDLSLGLGIKDLVVLSPLEQVLEFGKAPVLVVLRERCELYLLENERVYLEIWHRLNG